MRDFGVASALVLAIEAGFAGSTRTSRGDRRPRESAEIALGRSRRGLLA